MKTVVAVLSVVVISPCFARTITVDDNGPADFNNIQAAINDSDNGDTIIIQPGTYTGTGNRDISYLGKSVIVQSIDPNDSNITAATIIDCNSTEANPHRGFIFNNSEGANSQLIGFTIKKAYYIWHGGGIYCDGSNPVIKNCIINNCVANCSSNIYQEHGGGIYLLGSSPTISHCIISENWANGGGGIYCENNSNPIINNCMIVNNSVNNYGGGVNCWDSHPVISFCTIAGNSANIGGGINYYSAFTVNNCIIRGNSGGDFVKSTSSQVFPVVSYSDIGGGYAGTGNINSNPFFINPAGGNYHISANSPCVDKGDPNYTGLPGEVDVDGDPRVANSRVDMGADEYTSSPAVIDINPQQFTFTAEAGGLNPPSQKLYIGNVGNGRVNWTINCGCNWLSAEPNTGTSTDEPNEVSLSVDASGQPHGLYQCTLTVSDPCASNSPQTANITLVVNTKLLVPSVYSNIQSAINSAINGDTVLVDDGIYTGPGNRDIDFAGKAITVKSKNGPEQCIIDCNGTFGENHRGFNFISGEGQGSVLEGFTIANGFLAVMCGGGAGINIDGASPTISKCVVNNNHVELVSGSLCFCMGGGIYISGGSPFVANCIITSNSVGDWGWGGGIYCESSLTEIYNCTIHNNTAIGYEGQGGGVYSSSGTMKNSIIWNNNAQTSPQIYGGSLISFSDIQGGWAGTGNINSDPCFADPCSGDFHLKSQAGRWNPNTQIWVKDIVQSPCIDAGDPNSDWTAELWPHGKRINMGAYGGTPQAGMSLSTIGNIANLDNDPCDIIDFNDLKIFVEKWCYEEDLLAADLDRNGHVDFNDFAIFGGEYK
jgi:hypothetical protein